MPLTHHFLPAASSQTHSLVVLLHGFGAEGRSILGLGNSLAQALPNTVFCAPDAPNPAPGRPGGRMWYTIPELDGSSPAEADARLRESARQLDVFLDEQLVVHGLPASALALVGFSQGAGLAYEVGPRRSAQLAGVVAIAGRMKRKAALGHEALSKPPFLILTGADDRLMAKDEIQATTATLTQAGISVDHSVMAGTGHGISDAGLAAAQQFLSTVLPNPGTR